MQGATISRAEKAFLREDEQKKLQKEGPNCLLTIEALRRHDILTGATELRQFACPKCNHPWWKHVPRTKPVSTCHKCHIRYDALDREKEFGIGRYICEPCGHTFYARCEATEMHECYKCNHLVGPPYINPRFKPIRRRYTKSDSPPPRIHDIINASTPHESTGSTIASSFITVDLGDDIRVQVEKRHSMAAKDYSKPFEDEPVQSPADIRFETSGESVDQLEPESELSSVVGEVGDLESEGEFGFDFEDSETMEEMSRKRTAASDSDSDSDESGSLEEDKMSVRGSEPDSGIGTGSNLASGSDTGSVSSSASEYIINMTYFSLYMYSMYAEPPIYMSICEFKQTDYSGIVFSKRKQAAIITREGGKIEGEGIRLVVPPGAVAGNDEANISLQACLGGPFCLPEGLNFLSPVYLIEPPFAFHDNVTLSIDMFIKLDTEEDLDEIKFVTSPTKGVVVEENAQWNFRVYGAPKFSVGSNQGEIDLKHFCFAAFAGFGKYQK